MIRNLTLRIFLALLLFISGRSEAENVIPGLSEATTATDSIRCLYQAVDRSSGRQQSDALEQLYRVAVGHGEENTILDVIRIGANIHSANDSILEVLEQRVAKLPDSDNSRATALYIKTMREIHQIKTLPESVRDKRLRQYLSNYKDLNPADEYERIGYLFTLCAYLRLATDGDLLVKYFTELQRYIDRLPARELNLRVLFYSRAADVYLANGMFEEAAGASRILLDIIAQLEKQSKANGRDNSRFDRPKYLCYRRLLKCRQVISPEEAETYYSRLLSLPRSTPDIRQDFEIARVPEIYYLMHKRRYADAIPLINRHLDNTDARDHEYRFLVAALIEAAEAVGDNDSLLKGLQLNNDLLKRRIDEKARQSYNELQIVYEVNDLKQENDDLSVANQQFMIERHNERFTYAVITLVVLLVLLMTVLIYYRRAKRLSANLIHSNSVIAGERDALRRAQKELIEARDKAKTADHLKTDFVNNMGHEIRTPLTAIVEYTNLIADCADEGRRGYFRRFADIISLNTDLLLTLVNDVLELPSIENAKTCVRVSVTSARRICTKAIAAIRDEVAPDVKLVFVNEDDIDVKLMTDPHRVEQVIVNLLSNAAKFTQKGTITLDYTLSADGHDISFAVSDTGIGIPRGKEEIIFSRFEKLNSSMQGKGLGLYVGKLMAGLLKGELRLDSAYHKGARFIFTIPVNYEVKSEK